MSEEIYLPSFAIFNPEIAEQAKALENARSELLEAGFSVNSGVVAQISAALSKQMPR